ncbi:hypothetical protein MCOR14_005486 [Pyricularia oryzae]|nr:hypothetical protein MCOR14_005486 [Pyricularia oryzae]
MVVQLIHIDLESAAAGDKGHCWSYGSSQLSKPSGRRCPLQRLIKFRLEILADAVASTGDCHFALAAFAARDADRPAPGTVAATPRRYVTMSAVVFPN